jgi:hypothetical protein
MLPGTGNETLDLVFRVAITVGILVGLVLLIRNYRGR